MSDGADPRDAATEPPPPATPPQWDSTPAAAPEEPTPPPKPWYRRRLTAIAAVAAAVLAYPLAKIAIGFLAVSVISGAVTGVFGNQWDRLPSDVRSDYSDRLDAAYGDTLDDLSDAAVGERVQSDVRHGLLRTDDATLIRRLELQTAAVKKLPLADCATFARSSIAGQVPPDAMMSRFLEVMSAEEYRAWTEIWILAVEAERAGSPATRTVPDADQSATVDAWLATFSDAEFQKLQSMAANEPTSDEDACDLMKYMYAQALAMDHDTLAIIAFIDVAAAP